MAAPSLDVIPVVAAPFCNVILWKAEAGGYPQLHSEFEGPCLNTFPNPKKKKKKVIEVPPQYTHTCCYRFWLNFSRLSRVGDLLALWRLTWLGGEGQRPAH